MLGALRAHASLCQSSMWLEMHCSNNSDTFSILSIGEDIFAKILGHAHLYNYADLKTASHVQPFDLRKASVYRRRLQTSGIVGNHS